MLTTVQQQSAMTPQVTCYQLGSALNAHVEPGFRVREFKQSLALFVGWHAIALDRWHTPKVNRDLVYAACLKQVGNGYLTSDKLDNEVLLHVDMSIPKGVKPRVRFFTGILPEENITLSYDGQALVRFPFDGDVVTLFRCDGSVRQIKRQRYELIELDLSPEEQGLARIKRAQTSLTDSETLSFENSVRLRDGALHQLLHIVEFSGSEGLREKSLKLIRKYRQQGYAQSVVRRLQELAPEEVQQRQHVGYDYAGNTAARKGPPAVRRAHLDERAARQRQELLERFGNKSKPNGKDAKKKK